MATYIYDYHDERGEFHAYVRDEAGNIIWEVHYPEYLEDDDTGELLEGSTIFEDGYLKNADDLEGLYYYLRDFGAIEEDDEVVKLEDYEKREDAKDNLLDFAIPNWAMSAIVNGDTSGLEDEDIQKIDAFENRLVKLYGNANLMLGDVDGEDNLGLTMGNDIEENAMTECYRMYLRPTKSYEDGGALMDGQYGYGTSYLAKGGALEDKIKKKLGENFELPIEMAVYVPSTEKANQIVSKREYASRIDEVRSYLANLFGGYSSEGIDGGYVSDEKGLIQEDVTKVTAFSTKENFEQKLETLITQIKKWCGAWGQESMGFEFEGDLFYISKDGKFMDGGNIPEGYHMMPDGTIMPDSAHLDGGGEVDDDEDEDKEQEHLEYVSEETNIPIDVLKEYANNKGIKIEELDTDLGYQGSFSDEEAFAQYCANEGLISNLSYYLEMYPTDKRILIGEMTDNYINDLSDEDILSQSSYDDDFEKLKEAEANLSIQEGELENLIDEKQDLVDSQDVESMRESDREEMDRALEEFDQKIEDVEATISSIKDDIRDIGDYDDIIERAREEVRDNYYDDLKDRLDKDAVGYFVDELGYDENDLVDKNGFYVDTSALARDLGHDYDFIEYEGDVYVFSSYYKYGGGIDLGSSFDKFKKSLNILPQEIQSQISDNDAINMAIKSVGDAWEDLTDYDRSLIVKSFKEGYNKGSYAKGGEFKVDPKYTHFAVGKRDGKIVTGWEYKDLDKESIKYYTKIDLVDMDFKPSDFRILTAKYLKAQGVDPFNWDNWRKHGDNYYAHGGSVEEGNLEMLKNQAKEFKHHAEELGEVLDKNPRVDAWVVAKAERATSDLSDITHYLDGQEDGESFEDGGVTPKVFEKVNITIRDVDMGGDVIYKNDHWINKKALDEKSSSDIGKYILNKYGLDYGNTYKFSLKRTGETREKMAHGGEVLSDKELKSIMPNIDTSKKKLDEVSDNERQEVASRIDDLVDMVNKAKEKGEKPKYFNLCDISIPGTNIYCDDNLGIDRNDMPQFKGNARPNSLADQLPKDPKSNEVDTEEFFKLMLNKRGIDVNSGDDGDGIEVEPDVLKATQMNMVGDKVAGMYNALEKDPTIKALTAPIYVSNDGYVLDGHHRWAAIVTYNAKNPNNPIPMKVRVIDMPIEPLVELANDFANSIGIQKKAAVAGQMARGGELLSDVDMYVKIHGYYPMEVMAMRGEGIGQAIVRNEAHNFELSGVDSRKAEEMGYEFDYDKKGWVEIDEDDDFAKGGEVIERINKHFVITDKKGNQFAIKNWVAQGYIIPFDGREYWEHFQVPEENWIRIQDIDWTKFNVSKLEFYDFLNELDKKKAEILLKYHSSFKDGGEMAKGGEVEKKEYINKYIKDLGLDVEEMPARQYRYLSKQASRKYEKEKLEKMPYRKYRVSYRIPFGAIHSEVVDARTSNEAKTIFRKTHGRDIQGNQDKILSVTLTKVKKEDGGDVEYAKGGKTKWIQEAIQKPGALRETAKRKGLIEGEEKLSKTDLKKLEKVGGKTGQRARLAATLKGLGKKKKMAKGGETKFINLSTRKGQSEVEKYTNQGWGIKFQNDKFAILERGGKKKIS